MTNATIVTPPSYYQTTLRLNPMDVVDAETYSCSVTVTPYNAAFITGTTVSTARNITEVLSKTNSYVSQISLLNMSLLLMKDSLLLGALATHWFEQLLGSNSCLLYQPFQFNGCVLMV